MPTCIDCGGYFDSIKEADAHKCIGESNLTGCLDPDKHQGECGYSLATCSYCRNNKLITTQEVINGKCAYCTKNRP